MHGMKPTRELLADYAILLNRHGADSEEAEHFLQQHRSNAEFFELAQLSRKLKKALTAPASDAAETGFCSK